MSTQAVKTTRWFLGLQSLILSDPRYERLRPLFTKGLSELKDLMAVRGLHYTAYHAIFRNLSQPAEWAMIQAIDTFVREKMKISDKSLSEGRKIEMIANALAEYGHAQLPSLSADKVRDMRDYFDSTKCYAGPYDPNCPEPDLFSVDELHERGENTARYKTRDVIECPHVMRAATDPALVSILTKHLGTIPVILDYSAWWSFANDDQDSQHAQLFHFDLADYRFCLMFLYLTDVDMDGGPHTLFEKTHELDEIIKIREAYPGDPDEWDHWYFQNLRKTDDEMARYFGGKQPVSLTGDKGTSLLVNTRGIHKGMLPKKKDRLIVQIVYGITPMLQTLFDDPLKIGTPAAKSIPDWMTKPPYDYVNWFFATK